MQLSRLLKECLERAGLNQSQAAIRLGRGKEGRKHLNAVLNGKQRPSLEMVEAILAFCGLTLEQCLVAPKYFDITKKEELARKALEKGLSENVDDALKIVAAAFDHALLAQIQPLFAKKETSLAASRLNRKPK